MIGGKSLNFCERNLTARRNSSLARSVKHVLARRSRTVAVSLWRATWPVLDAPAVFAVRSLVVQPRRGPHGGRVVELVRRLERLCRASVWRWEPRGRVRLGRAVWRGCVWSAVGDRFCRRRRSCVRQPVRRRGSELAGLVGPYDGHSGNQTDVPPRLSLGRCGSPGKSAPLLSSSPSHPLTAGQRQPYTARRVFVAEHRRRPDVGLAGEEGVHVRFARHSLRQQQLVRP